MPLMAARLVELETGLRTLETGPLPPDGREFEVRCRKHVRDSLKPGQLTELITVLGCRGPGNPGPKRDALLHVLASSVAPQRFPWSKTLDVCERDWPQWGYPYRKAAVEALARGELRRVLKYLERANLRSRVADWKLIDAFQQLKIAAQRRRDEWTQASCHYWISRHKYTVSNFSQTVDFARRIRDFSLRNDVVLRWLAAFGDKPDDWPVENNFLDLSSAGNLCMHVNQVRAALDQRHDHAYWNRSALGFLQRSLDSVTKDDDRMYVRTRISETCAQMLRFALPVVMSDREFEQLFSLAQATAVDLTERARRAGGRADSLYQASRHLAAVYTGAVRRARAKRADPEIIQRLISQADAHYRATIHYARGDKKEIVSQFRSEFLYESIRFEVAFDALMESSPGPFETAVAQFKTGRRDDAVKALCSAIRRNGDAKTKIGYAQLLAHYLQRIDLPGESIEKGVRQHGTETLRRMVPLFVEACRLALRRDDLPKAERYLEIAMYFEQPPSPNLLHLRARIQLKLNAPPARVAEQLAPIVLSDAGAPLDNHLRAVFLQALARCDQVLISPERAWQLVEVSRKHAVEGGSAVGEDAFSVADVLLWELRSGQHENWPQHLLRARASFPTNPRWAQLPALAYDVVPGEAAAISLAVLSGASADPAARPWTTEVLARLPDSFFLQPHVLTDLGSLLGNCFSLADPDCESLSKTLGDRLSGSLLSLWLEGGEIANQLANAIQWTGDWVPLRYQISCWTQLLGASRGRLEASLVVRHQERLDSFLHDVESLQNMSRAKMMVTLDTLVDDLRGLHVVESPASPGNRIGEIVRHCVTASRRYRPWKPDPFFWPDLGRLVSKVCRDGGTAKEVIADSWLQVQAAIAQLMNRRLVPVIQSRFHRLKNEIARGEGTERLWRDRIVTTVIRARAFLDLHRWPQLDRVDLRDVLSDVAYRPPFAAVARQPGRDLQVFALRPELPIDVSGDRALLVELTTELFRNSLKAIDRAGASGWIYSEVRRTGDSAILSVRDSGGGCPNYRLRALNAFEDDPEGFVYDGTGFGHRFCSRIATLHDGELHYDFQESTDFGLVAELRLPLHAIAPANKGETR